MKKRRQNIKIFIASIWLLFTASLVIWWWWVGLKQQDHYHRMLLWEGSILLLTVMAGGFALLYLTKKDEARHERLRLFFANFSHDLKTSITRLRLQGDVLTEDESLMKNDQIKQLLKDISRLDIQLENSLWMANIQEQKLYLENIKLSSILDSLRLDFSDLGFAINKDALIRADRRALLSVLRNIVQNSILHGHADHIQIECKLVNQHSKSVAKIIEISIKDNGKGFLGQIENLGRRPLHSENHHSSGIGLYLSRELIERMHGRLDFLLDQKHLLCVIQLPGESL